MTPPDTTSIGEPASGSGGHAGRVRNAFWAVILALTCVHATMAATRVAGALWLLQSGHPEWMVGAMLSLYAVAPLGLSLWAGRLADKHGLHRPLAIGVVMGLMGPVALLAHLSVATLAFSALCTGGAVAMAAVAIQREAGNMATDPDDLKRVFSWVALGPAVSNAVSPIVVGLLIDHVGFAAAFAFAGALPASAWVAGRWVPRQRPGFGEASGTAGRAAREAGAWSLFANVPLRRLILVNIALSSAWDAHSFAVPVIGHAKQLSASAIGTVLGSFSFAATGVRLAISRFAPRLDERRALLAAMALAAATSAAYPFLPGVASMMAGSFALGLALGSVQPMVLSMLHQVTPPARRGQALGLRMLCTNLATVGMPTLFGVLAASAAAGAPMWLMAAIVGGAMVPARKIEAPGS